MIDKIVLSMAALRVLSGSIELLAAFLMFRFNNVEKALLVNSSLALVGPIIFITITTLGLIGIADKVSWSRLLWIGLGLACLFFGILKK
ncbi:YqhV family protein [Paenibacillus alkalitolerans]|uniref:YqhV family protein n=1 Tax=Paenibacillus alkalitolerans TaxID=2799335 RepID=UPI001F3FE00F|nr:YqhV family protein [Paenibacillus alkalitolerans]